MVTVVLCGGSTLTLLTWLGIPLGVEDDDDKSNNSPSRGAYNSMADPPVPPGSEPADKSRAAKAWSGFDTKYMKPFLTNSNPTLMETLPDCCHPLARALTSTEQLQRHPSMMNGQPNEEPTIINDNDEEISVEINDSNAAENVIIEKHANNVKQRLPSLSS